MRLREEQVRCTAVPPVKKIKSKIAFKVWCKITQELTKFKLRTYQKVGKKYSFELHDIASRNNKKHFRNGT